MNLVRGTDDALELLAKAAKRGWDKYRKFMKHSFPCVVCNDGTAAAQCPCALREYEALVVDGKVAELDWDIDEVVTRSVDTHKDGSVWFSYTKSMNKRVRVDDNEDGSVADDDEHAQQQLDVLSAVAERLDEEIKKE